MGQLKISMKYIADHISQIKAAFFVSFIENIAAHMGRLKITFSYTFTGSLGQLQREYSYPHGPAKYCCQLYQIVFKFGVKWVT